VSHTADQEAGRLRRARALDVAALASIYDDYQPAIYRYLFRQVGDVETTRDLTADVFHRLLKALHAGQGPTDHLSAWLYRTAHNILVDHYRRRQHRCHLPLDETMPGDGAEPADEVERRLSAARLREALCQLTTDQQQVVALKFLAELPNEEVAQVLDKPVGAVKSLQHRALAALQRHLSTPGEGTP
jgi:RNA polymerase sigma-70 factor (ECF subfamily)